jgi:hypothetical protein
VAKRRLNLATPFPRDNGMTQTQVELDYIYIHDDHIAVFTKQGNVISLPITPGRQTMIDNLEDAIKARLDAGQP